MWAYGMAAIAYSRCEFGISLRIGNYDGTRRMTQSLLPQKGMWAYGIAAITHCRLRTHNFFRNLITVMAWGIRYGCYYLKMGCEHTARPLSPTTKCKHTAWPLSPTLDANSKLFFLGNLIIVMARGVRHGCYYLKKGREHTTWPLLSTIECKLKVSSGTW